MGTLTDADSAQMVSAKEFAHDPALFRPLPLRCHPLLLHGGTVVAKPLPLRKLQTGARALGLAAVELETRVELLENHASFRAMGCQEINRTAHPGYAQPTSITFRKPV